MATSHTRADRILLLEVGLILTLLGLGVVLYWRPAAEGLLAPRWWHWVILTVLFFTVLGLRARRRSNRNRATLRASLRGEDDLADDHRAGSGGAAR